MIFFVCNTIKHSQLPKTPVLPIVHLSFLSVALGHTTDVVPRLETAYVAPGLTA